ncbi:MAG: hypothetical protein ACKV1O_28280 [Saprospiraceae bacterium]
MEKIKQAFKILSQNNYEPIVKTESLNDNLWNQLLWTDENGDECSIYEENIAIETDKIAWFQSSKRDNHLLKIYECGIEFVWIPFTYNPVFGCRCLLIEWYKNHLLFIYQEKHDIYICTVINKTVKHFNFHGEEIERKGDIISYETYTNKLPDKVRLVKIPELVELEPINKSEAEKIGLLPKWV